MIPARRIRIARPGNYDVLRLEAFAVESPGHGQVLIEVQTIGVNYADGIIRMGLYESAKKLHGYPITPGFEVSGRVLAVGASVSRFKAGDEVLALTLFDGYSSHLLVDQDRVFGKPAALSFDQAAAIPTVFLTAWFMVHELARTRTGERWLVHSAAGGVGAALAQLGRLAGCEVTGVVGHADKTGAAQAAGCTHRQAGRGSLATRGGDFARRFRRRLRCEWRQHAPSKLLPSGADGPAVRLRLCLHAAEGPWHSGLAKDRLGLVAHPAIQPAGHDPQQPQRHCLQPQLPVRAGAAPESWHGMAAGTVRLGRAHGTTDHGVRPG
jgi:hypothetical protein